MSDKEVCESLKSIKLCLQILVGIAAFIAPFVVAISFNLGAILATLRRH